MELKSYKPKLSTVTDTFGPPNLILSQMCGPQDSSICMNTDLDKKIPLLILVFGCATIPKYREEILTIQETWGKDAKDNNIPVLFFLGEEKTDLEGPEYIYLPEVKNDYHSSRDKQFIGYIVSCTKYNPNTIFSCGTDTFINIPKLIKLSNMINPEAPLFIGNDGFVKQIGPLVGDFFSGGGGLLTTRELHRRILPYLLNISKYWLDACEVFRSNEIACDVILSFLCHYVKAEFIQCKNIYHCSYNGIDSFTGPLNKDKIITCHNMKRDDFLMFHSLLKNNNYFT